jgi:hypothetical protein
MLVGTSMTFTASHSICLNAMVRELPPEKKITFNCLPYLYFWFFTKMVFLERTGDT